MVRGREDELGLHARQQQKQQKQQQKQQQQQHLRAFTMRWPELGPAVMSSERVVSMEKQFMTCDVRRVTCDV